MEETEKRRWLGIKVTSKHSGYIWPVWAAPQAEPPSPSSVGTVALEVHHAPPVQEPRPGESCQPRDEGWCPSETAEVRGWGLELMMVAPESTPGMDMRERNRNDSLGVGMQNFSGGPVMMMSPSKAGVQV